MSKHLNLCVPNGTKAITISLVVERDDKSLTLITKLVDTKQILEGRDIEIEIEIEEETE